MAASLTCTAGASLRASTSSLCRCSMSAATQKSRQQRTFSSMAASSSSSSIPQAGDKKASRLLNSSHGGSRLERSASDSVKNARNHVSLSRLTSMIMCVVICRIANWACIYVQARQQIRHFHASNRSLATKNPYTVLGVDKSASSSDIKKKYYQVSFFRWTDNLTQDEGEALASRS